VNPNENRAPTYITHPDPVERRSSNYIAQVDLAPFGLAGQFEQVWLHDRGSGSYAMACIPFMLYGLALGDLVRLSEDGKVASLIEASGHRVLRLMLVEDPDPARLERAIAEITACVANANLLTEWHGPRFIAVDVPPAARPESVFAVMGRIVEEGRGYWEWADSHPFTAS
jgi:hypothetical protein